MLPSHDDYRAIEQLLYRYAWMVDRREWALMDSVFAPGATIDYASTGGLGKTPYREALAWLHKALEPWPINLHHITNVTVDIDGDHGGDHGRSTCYFTAPMARRTAGGGMETITNAGLYVDALVRTADGWRIAERFCDMTIQIGSLPPGYVIPGA